MKTAAVFTSLLAMALAAPAPPAPHSPLNNLIPKNPATPSAPNCNLQSAQMPTAPTPLPKPDSGATLGLVAIGKGTQNYTCADSSATTIPVAVGALATLYNASCVQAAFPQFMSQLTQMSECASSSQLQALPIVGKHYFFNSTTPAFDINSLGTQHTSKVNSSSAPSDPTVNVAWLYLNAQDNATKIVNVYRVETNNGMQPATCSGMRPGLFTVPYAAQYWFWVRS